MGRERPSGSPDDKHTSTRRLVGDQVPVRRLSYSGPPPGIGGNDWPPPGLGGWPDEFAAIARLGERMSEPLKITEPPRRKRERKARRPSPRLRLETALKAVKAAGIEIGKVEIDADGKVAVVARLSGEEPAPRWPPRSGRNVEGLMPKKLPPHVDHYYDRHGKLRWAFRRGHGPRTTLPPHGIAEFDAAYAAARSQRSRRAPRQASTAQRAQHHRRPHHVVQKGSAVSPGDHEGRLLQPARCDRPRPRAPQRVGDDEGAHREAHPRAACRSARRRARHAEEAPHPDRARHRDRLAQARSIARHQAAKERGNPVVDRCRDRRLRGALADRHEATARLRVDAQHRPASHRRAPHDMGRRDRRHDPRTAQKTGVKVAIRAPP